MVDRAAVEKALGPVWDWYQPDDQPDRPVEEILRDISWDLQWNRQAILQVRGMVSTEVSRIRRSAPVRSQLGISKEKLLEQVERLEQFCETVWEITDKKKVEDL